MSLGSGCPMGALGFAIFFDTFRSFLCGVDNYYIEFGNPVWFGVRLL